MGDKGLRERVELWATLGNYGKAIELGEKMDNCVIGQEVVGKQWYCGIKLRIIGQYRELWKTQGRRGLWEGTKNSETMQRIVGNNSSVGEKMGNCGTVHEIMGKHRLVEKHHGRKWD